MRIRRFSIQLHSRQIVSRRDQPHERRARQTVRNLVGPRSKYIRNSPVRSVFCELLLYCGESATPATLRALSLPMANHGNSQTLLEYAAARLILSVVGTFPLRQSILLGRL